MSDDRYSPDEFTDWPEGIVGAEEQDERVFWLAAATMPDLVNRLALVLGEHMACGDELHVTYNAMQSGFQHFPPPTRRKPVDRPALRVQRLRGAAAKAAAAVGVSDGAAATTAIDAGAVVLFLTPGAGR